MDDMTEDGGSGMARGHMMGERRPPITAERRRHLIVLSERIANIIGKETERHERHIVRRLTDVLLGE
jgi:hypothetical protein